MEFNNDQKYNLLSRMGYQGPAEGPAMEAFIQSSPGVAAKMGKFSRALQKRTGMAEGGFTDWRSRILGSITGTSPTPVAEPTTLPEGPAPDAEEQPAELTSGQQLSEAIIQDPSALATQADVAQMTATPETIIDSAAGQMQAPTAATTATVGSVQTAEAPAVQPAATMEAVTAADQVAQVASGTQAVQGQVTPQALVQAAQQTESSVSDMQAAQGTAILMTNPVQREVQAGEMISGSSVDAAKVNAAMESIQAAEATPSKEATVQGQLENLMAQFEGGNTPAWAAGAMRNANAILAQRGLGASSLAGQAVIQAAMESALPIAQADANTRAQFESQNLSNRQQVALFAAEQRARFLGQEFDQNFQARVLNAAKISDIANMNFTAEQTVALENSRIANTVNLANLGNRQAMVLAQVAALANLDMANLNNRQQAAVQNAQSFLQMDLTNLNNAQQVELFRAQSNIQALFTDQAAQNAALQFNAASENQTNQFFADLAARVSQFNADQMNAISQFNAGETNVTERFNSQLEAARQQFNAQNSLIIAQANAQWRQNITTLNTAAQNEANMELARTQNALTAKALDEIWQSERDTLAYAFTASESEKDRALELLIADKQEALAKEGQDAAEKAAMASVAAKIIFGEW